MSMLDHSGNQRFYDYYAKASQSGQTWQRFASIRDATLRILESNGSVVQALEVADIGCGAGTQCIMWAELGHRVHGLDINEPLIKLAWRRAAKLGYDIDFRVGSAVKLPWADKSMDICLVPELLEHVAEWKPCLNEFARILKPGGVLFLTTTNKLCPKQQEFSLPFYSWYPAPVKRYFEQLAVTTWPKLSNYAKYPAVNWFSFYHLRTVLANLGFRCMDRFDVMDLTKKGTLAKAIVPAVRAIPLLRCLAHVATPSLIIFAVKEGSLPA